MNGAGERCKRALGEALLDACFLVSHGWRLLCMAASALLSVESDPLGRSLAEIRSPGCPWTYRVLPAPRGREDSRQSSDYRRCVRAASWLYRCHANPVVSDWRSCCARFGLAGPQEHVLQKYDSAGRVMEECLVTLDLREGNRAFVTVAPTVRADGASRPVEIFMLTDLGAQALFSLSGDPHNKRRD
jgi:hypothetical protein